MKRVKVDNLTHALLSAGTGETIALDLDEVLLLAAMGQHKYQRAAELTERRLPDIVQQIMAREVKVIGLTARSPEFTEQTRQQLREAGFPDFPILHAPGKYQKGRVLREYVESLASERPRRLYVFDDLSGQLDSIAESFADTRLPAVELYHYMRPVAAIVVQPAEGMKSAVYPDLTAFTYTRALGGGTQSTFAISDDQQRQQVLKWGSHSDASQCELLCKAIYQVLGVPTPECVMVNTLPKQLAKTLAFPSRFGLFQLSAYVDAATGTEAEHEAIITAKARHHFLAHVLLGNIDVAKPDNFMVGKDGQAYLVDAGSNFLFRARGERRSEDADEVSEVDSLRDSQTNAQAYAWFGALSDDEIKAQLAMIVAKQTEIEETVWRLAAELNMPPALRDEFIEHLAQRLDNLVTRFGPELKRGAKIDKRIQLHKTAAGILSYAQREGQPCVLLAKRVRHPWWDNLGGKSELGDDRLAETALREVREESGRVLIHAAGSIAQVPFHDMITQTKQGLPFTYRMYLVEHPAVEEARFRDSEFRDKEHTEYAWVPVQDLLEALDKAPRIKEEEQETIQVGDRILYPPLYRMLMQGPVRQHLMDLAAGKPLEPMHTQGTLAATQPPKADPGTL
ncbi:MAG: hypothetical protein A3E83_00320 [Gammaproteobacteria bacterium RIFCSPHIGHO2_12_FULL_41_20]|nr:MAG: hypothetical protein A3E83_00320 [Gammaproteobacteria bacterium RIFCSPHIGHO2_12_FULL_41_20]